jgi:hypothetical protein
VESVELLLDALGVHGAVLALVELECLLPCGAGVVVLAEGGVGCPRLSRVLAIS